MEKFDENGAFNLIDSKKTLNKLNPLFVDTKLFDMSNRGYIPNLDRPETLEKYEKEFDNPAKY